MEIACKNKSFGIYVLIPCYLILITDTLIAIVICNKIFYNNNI